MLLGSAMSTAPCAVSVRACATLRERRKCKRAGERFSAR